MTDQYHKLGQWYQGKALLVPVGDDFYFSREDDWTENILHFRSLFKRINMNQAKYGIQVIAKLTLCVIIDEANNFQVQFGTLKEYFAELGEPTDYPTLTGDFFPYMDTPTGYPYWTGYYTTRPYYKRLERIIQSRLRGADLLSAFDLRGSDWHKIKQPRRDLALFQHHDAITGTSKEHVMRDYLDRYGQSMCTFP